MTHSSSSISLYTPEPPPLLFLFDRLAEQSSSIQCCGQNGARHDRQCKIPLSKGFCIFYKLMGMHPFRLDEQLQPILASADQLLPVIALEEKAVHQIVQIITVPGSGADVPPGFFAPVHIIEITEDIAQDSITAAAEIAEQLPVGDRLPRQLKLFQLRHTLFHRCEHPPFLCKSAAQLPNGLVGDQVKGMIQLVYGIPC